MVWSSWSGRVSCEPVEVARPRDEAAVCATVRAAAARGLGVRVVGSGHSFSPIVATDGVLISLDAVAGIESVDVAAGEAWLRAGSKLHDLGEPLLERGLCFANYGDIDVQSLAGALGTGTHGTGPTLPNLSAQVRSLRIVEADGELVEWNHTGPQRPLDAARVSLGAFGVVTAVRFALLPAYRLHQRIWKEPIDECLARLDERVAAHRHFEFFWMPGDDTCEMKAHDRTDAPSSPLDDRPGERIDHPSRVLPSVREMKFNEMEYAVPAEHGPACFAEVRKRIQQRHPRVRWPVEYRTLAADDGWLSPAHGRATVTISAHEDARRPCDAFFADLEPIFRAYEGRPHWGKVHFRSAEDLRPRYPMWDDFVALRRARDPQGRFLNETLRALFAA